MKIVTSCILFAAVVVSGSPTLAVVPQYKLTTLASFNSTNGSDPRSTLIADSIGNLYGTTFYGGANGRGTVFEVSAGTHALSTLFTFNGTNGANPLAGLIADSGGNLFGTTLSGGANNNGTVFEIAAGTHAFTTLVTFNLVNGGYPETPLLADASGNLYGTTADGGDLTLNFGDGDGTVFKIANDAARTLSTLATFSGPDGRLPLSGLSADGNGNLYGTTYYGGASDFGTVFKVVISTPSLISLASFNSANGANPVAGLIADASGNLYGTTYKGGPKDDGTVFELDANTHTINTLVNFNYLNGSDPYGGLLADASGNLFGTSHNGGTPDPSGTVYEIDAVTHALSTLATFKHADYPYGAAPYSSLLADSSGNLYGTTEFGGAFGHGSVFELSPLPEPSALVLGLLALGGLSVSRRAFG